MKGLIIMSTIKLVEVETWENNWYWTIPNETALTHRTVLNEAEFILPDGFVNDYKYPTKIKLERKDNQCKCVITGNLKNITVMHD